MVSIEQNLNSSIFSKKNLKKQQRANSYEFSQGTTTSPFNQHVVELRNRTTHSMNHDQVNYISMRRICNRLHTNKKFKFSL
eukprot:UN03601